MSKVMIVPPWGVRWVDPATKEKLHIRRLYRHAGSTVLSIPREVRRELNWETGQIVVLKVVKGVLMVGKPDIPRTVSQGVSA